MRRILVPLWILSASAASAEGSDAPACRLAPAECARALHEVAVDAEAFAEDERLLGLGLSPSDRARALIRRDAERMAERFRHLPAPVAAEVARLQACQALDGAPPGAEAARPDRLCR